MKKYYRVFIIMTGSPVLHDNSKYNWFDTVEEAEHAINDSYQREYNSAQDFTILPVYSNPDC